MNNKSCILTNPIQIGYELSPIDLIEAIIENGEYSRAKVSELYADIEEDTDCIKYTITGYKNIYDALNIDGGSYAIGIFSQYGLNDTQQLKLTVYLYDGVPIRNGSKLAIKKSSLEGYLSAVVYLTINKENYLIYDMRTSDTLSDSFVLEKEWYLLDSNNASELWKELSNNLSKQIKEIIEKGRKLE